MTDVPMRRMRLCSAVEMQGPESTCARQDGRQSEPGSLVHLSFDPGFICLPCFAGVPGRTEDACKLLPAVLHDLGAVHLRRNDAPLALDKTHSWWFQE